MPKLKRIKPVRSKAEKRLPARLAIKSEIMAVSRGNRPLQGTRLLVRMAMSRSLGESMIRQPVTPAALQPSPMAMVRHCLPQARHFLKALSILKATRGR